MATDGTVRAEVGGASHPEDTVLASFASGRLSTSERGGVLEHLDACARCREVLVALQGDGPLDASKTLAHDPLIGQRLGEYEVLHPMAQGGMGRVYVAEQPTLGKKVAIKVLLPESAGDRELVQRLHVEARAIAALRHPNIVDVYGFGSLPDGQPYLVMELLDGQSLSTRLRERGPFGVAEVLTVLEQTMGALSAAHAARVIHRDLKPGNLFLAVLPSGGWHVTVLDFGLAKQLDRDALTAPDVVLGTPSYMPPERIRGEPASDRSDIYSMGVVAWELLTGRLPFDGDSVRSTMRMHLDAAVPAFPLGAQVPAGLQALVQRMLAKSAAERPAAVDVVHEVASLRRALEASGAQPPPAQRPPTVSMRAPAQSGGATTAPEAPIDTQPEVPAAAARTLPDEPAARSTTDDDRPVVAAVTQAAVPRARSRSLPLAAAVVIAVIAGVAVLSTSRRSVQTEAPATPEPELAVAPVDEAPAPASASPADGPRDSERPPARRRPPPARPQQSLKSVEDELASTRAMSEKKLTPAVQRIVGLQLQELERALGGSMPPAEVHSRLEKLKAEYGLR